MSAPRAKALCHFRFEGLWEARLSPPSNHKWQILLRRILALTQSKTLKTGYRDVTSNSQLWSRYAKHRASLFSRFSLLWYKPEKQRVKPGITASVWCVPQLRDRRKPSTTRVSDSKPSISGRQRRLRWKTAAVDGKQRRNRQSTTVKYSSNLPVVLE